MAELLSTHLEIPAWKVTDDIEVDRVRDAIVRRVAAIPEARAVAVTSDIPALHSPRVVTFAIGAESRADPTARPTADLSVGSTAFFDVMKPPIIAGRGFVPSDGASPAPVIIISRETARRFFGDAKQALGAQISIDIGDDRPRAPATVIGVASDVRVPGLEGSPRQRLYVLDTHESMRSFYLLVRAERPGALAQQVRTAIREVDAELPTYQLRTVAEAFDEEYSSNRLLSGLFAAFAILAILLASVGLYAVVSYGVSQRTQETAVRMALGASSRDVAAGVAGHSLKLAGVGAGIGLTSAFALAQSVRSILYGVGPDDPSTYLGALVVTALAAFLAAWVPTRRAMAIDPAQGLRQA